MELIYIIKPDKTKIKYKIIEKKLDTEKNSSNISTEYIDLLNKIRLSDDKDINYLYKATLFFSFLKKVNSPFINYIINILGLDNYYYFNFNDKNDKNIINNDKKNSLIIFSIEEELKNNNKNLMYDCNKVNTLYKIKLNFLKNILKKIKNGNNIAFIDTNFCDNYNYDLYNILSLIFEKVFVIDTQVIICFNFNVESLYLKYILDYDIGKDYYLSISPPQKKDKFNKYCSNIYESYIKLYKLILKKDENNLFIDTFKFYASFIKDPFIKKNDKKKLYNIYLEQFIIESFRRLFFNESNNKNKLTEIKIHSAINKEEGRQIQKIMRDYKFEKCLEVGMAFGISAFYILSSNEKASLISIDPFQSNNKQWNSNGLKLIKQIGFQKRHDLMEEFSYIALPKLLIKYGYNYFDFIFIDGWHTFDYTLIDFFYADKLLRKGGIILIDDALHKGVQKFVKYVESNYKNYKKIYTTNTQAGYLKLGEDSREWFFHSNF
jgi:hypothetical protein